MRRVERSIAIPAAPRAVFDYASSLDNLPSWQSGIVSAEMRPAGPIRIGSRALVVRELMGQRIEAPLEVTAYEPPRRLELHSEVSGVRADAILRVEPDGSAGSRVSFAMEISGSLLTAFMEPMIASAAEGDIGSSLDRLRQQLIAREPSDEATQTPSDSSAKP